MRILNIGCGTKVSNSPDIINIDWSIYARIKRMKILRKFIPFFLKGNRLKRFNEFPDNIMIYNVHKKLPFKSGSVDTVYHSHLLEHFDRSLAKKFLTEVKRILKPGGIHRIVVPDLEKKCRRYIAHLEACKSNQDEVKKHDNYIASIIEQSVRKEASGTSRKNFVVRFLENLFLGDARKRGETHQWMYDRISLEKKLYEAGYSKVHVLDFDKSLIQNWMEYGLDINDNGNQYRPGSLYIEAVK